MKNLKEQLIKLGSKNPELQNNLRPVIAELEKKARDTKKRRSMYSYDQNINVTADEMLERAVRKGFIDKSDTRDRALQEAAEDWAWELQLRLEKAEERGFGFGTSDYNYFLAKMVDDARKRGFETDFTYKGWSGR